MKNSIALIGFMATGKSTVGQALAEHFGLTFVDTDKMIEQQCGKSIPQIFAEAGEAHFRELETLALQDACTGEAKVIATGGGAVLKQQNIDCLLSGSHVICLTASPEVVLERTCEDASRPLLQSEDRLGKISSLMHARREHYAKAEHTIATDNWDVQAIIAEIEAFLQKNGWTGSKK